MDSGILRPGLMLRLQQSAWIYTPPLLESKGCWSGSNRKCGLRRSVRSLPSIQARIDSERAVKIVERVFEDTSDGSMAYNRWTAARAEAEETGLSEKHGTALIYGDVDLPLLFQALDVAPIRSGDRVVDIGSGFGRVVLATACAYSGNEGARVHSVTGIEILPLLHNYAREMDGKMRDEVEDMAVTRFLLGDYRKDEEAQRAICEADVVFAFATTWPGEDGVATELAATLKACLKVGSRAVMVDTQMPNDEFQGKRFALERQFERDNEATGSSTVSVYRVARTAEDS